MSRPTPLVEDEQLILRWLTREDSAGLDRLVHSDSVYRYLPTFLFERKYDDIHTVIDRLYTECLRESIILGVFLREGDAFCGLAEYYGFRNEIHKVSIGCRFLEAYWGKGQALAPINPFFVLPIRHVLCYTLTNQPSGTHSE